MAADPTVIYLVRVDPRSMLPPCPRCGPECCSWHQGRCTGDCDERGLHASEEDY